MVGFDRAICELVLPEMSWGSLTLAIQYFWGKHWRHWPYPSLSCMESSIRRFVRCWARIPTSRIRLYEVRRYSTLQLRQVLTRLGREQLFFISFARTWAMNNRPADAVSVTTDSCQIPDHSVDPCRQVQRIRTDPHSPNRYRTDGTVFNIPEFAQTFKCSKWAKVRYSSVFVLRLLTFQAVEPSARKEVHFLVLNAR